MAPALADWVTLHTTLRNQLSFGAAWRRATGVWPSPFPNNVRCAAILGDRERYRWSGRLHGDFRSGNLAENLGLLLLKGAAAVAEVPRSEDVGVDAVGTLLRRDSDGNHYAEDTFVVQLKSESARTLEYRDHAVEWLT